jgi:signal-transduction protein with cAMP-binding, CBS, and nucleotidyltransferase domain
MSSIERHVVRSVVTLAANVPCREAARIMQEKRIGSIGIRVDGQLTALVTERDLVTAVVAKGGDGSLTVGEAARALPRVTTSATEAECAALMRDNATRHLLVEERGEVIGLISMRDIIQLMLDEKQFVIEQLNTYISGR